MALYGRGFLQISVILKTFSKKMFFCIFNRNLDRTISLCSQMELMGEVGLAGPVINCTDRGCLVASCSLYSGTQCAAY